MSILVARLAAKEIAGKYLPLIGVTEKRLHVLKNGDMRTLPVIR